MRGGSEIKAITGLRGAAAVYVMIYHYAIGMPLSNPATTLIAHGYLAVDLFFVLSGFVMALNYGRMFRSGCSMPVYLRFLGRRIARVYPLYAVATVAVCVLVALGGLDLPHVADIPAVVGLNLLMVQSWGLAVSLDGPAWSISAEWAAYLLFPVILTPCLFRRAWSAWAVGVACVAALAVLCALPPGLNHKPFPEMLLDLHESAFGLPVLRCLPEFALGVLAFRLSATPPGLALARSSWMAAAVCGAILALLMLPRTDFAVVLLFPLLVLCLMSDRHAPGRLLASRPFMMLGELSYSIYLTHDLMGGLLGRVHEAIGAMGWPHAQSYAAGVGIVLTLLCAYLSYTLIELPGRRWLRQVFEGGVRSRGEAEASAP